MITTKERCVFLLSVCSAPLAWCNYPHSSKTWLEEFAVGPMAVLLRAAVILHVGFSKAGIGVS